MVLPSFHIQTISETINHLNSVRGLDKSKTGITVSERFNPVGIWCQNDVVLTSSRRIDVNTTYFLRHIPTGNVNS